MLLAPAIGIAAVTTGNAQTVLGVLGLVVLTSLLALIPGAGHSLPGSLSWWTTAVQLLIFSGGAGLLLYWQFFRRKTAWSRALIAATLQSGRPPAPVRMKSAFVPAASILERQRNSFGQYPYSPKRYSGKGVQQSWL